jgi:hypothetical protein
MFNEQCTDPHLWQTGIALIAVLPALMQKTFSIK